MAEMGAIRMFMEMMVFDKIPQDGSISYRELAASVGADESLISTSPAKIGSQPHLVVALMT